MPLPTFTSSLVPQIWAARKGTKNSTPDSLTLPAQKKIITAAGARLSSVLNAEQHVAIGSPVLTPATPHPPKSPLTLAKSANAVIVTREVDVESFRQSAMTRNTMMTTRTIQTNADAAQSNPSVPVIPGTSGGMTTVVTMTTDAKSLFSEKSVFKMDDDDEEGRRKWWRILGGMFTTRRSNGKILVEENGAENAERTGAAREMEDGDLNNGNGTNATKSRKWLWLLVGIAAVAVMALVIGLAVGLTKKSHSMATKPSSPQAVSGGSSSPTVPSQPLNSNLPAGFPVGTWSIFTFLDSVMTNCTSNAATWTCAPGATLQQNPSNPSAALSTFNFVVTGSAGNYMIAPTNSGPQSPVMSDISFSPTPLSVVGAGTSNEMYKFQITMNKRDNIANMQTTAQSNGQATCFYNGTTFQGYLYTKMARTYPRTDQSLPVGANIAWPFAAKLEEVVGGGANTPNCWTQDPGGVLGANITTGLTAMPQGNLCSCLWINYDS